MPVLELQNVTKQYKNGRGVENISFSVEHGEIFGLLGPNGAGKTTLMKCIVALSHPEQGKILINGYNVMEHFELAMQSVGTLISGVEAFDYLTAYQNLLLAARLYPSLEKGRIDEVLHWVGMEEHKHEKVKSFSTGMRQRLYLAAALLSKPSFVILDEPTNGLDIEGKLDFQELISRLAKDEGVTFILSTHLIDEVERLCNRIAILSKGKIIAEVDKNQLAEGQTFESFYINHIRKGKEVNQNAQLTK
ncbi:Bacitracin transport ATP-binding protein BcrA [Neobacillus rhizosphaerae]|uniref:Bacitracin transport ATP-binding protein BcrA n=1 Tax=Neobacillus rhizosphaerae TaxID=2880965 RepID=A0ABM9EK84_9BACI|nr:ABC transporter ATP-binding protein [Neobacillus rhizosphaerae]CAH2712990.1 Bacitracin transport ATP-binding protein BcrA [Neobacillus rhizosphaerae]